jgi:hypothetical protein
VKTIGTRCLIAAFFCASAIHAFAGSFKSTTIATGGSLSIEVPDDRFLVIRNFTQEGGTTRGVVTVTTDTGTANVLAAAIVDSGTSSTSIPLEVISNVVIAGPATVNVTCPADATDCFITYRKESN